MQASGRSILEVRELVCRFRSPGLPFLSGSRDVGAVDGVSLNVGRSEILGLVGESGCGKSTLAKAIVGLGPIDAKTMRFDGTDILRPLDRRPQDLVRRIQYVFQDPLGALDPRRTVLYQVAEPLLIHRRTSERDRWARARSALRHVNLGEEIETKYPHELSGGQRQRVVIARALVLEPDLLICDEPVSALDVSIQAQVINLLRDLRDRLDLSILFISHDLAVVRHLCDRIAVMYLGRLCEVGPAEQVFGDPRHPYTKALTSAIPPSHPRLAKSPVRLPGEPPDPAEPPSGCRFHPRCAEREDACSKVLPDLEALGDDGRFVACPVARRVEAAQC